MVTKELQTLRDLPKSKEKELEYALEERDKGNYEPSIKLGIVKKNVSKRRQLVRLSRRWKWQFKETLSLGFPNPIGEIETIKRCLEKNDPSEMHQWLRDMEKYREENDLLW